MLRPISLRSYGQTINSLVMFFEDGRAICKSTEQEGKEAKSVWFVLPCQWKSPMVSLHMVGFPGKQIQLKTCFAYFNYLVIYSLNLTLFLTLFQYFQHFLTMLGSTLAIPFILQIPMCFQGNKLVISEILSTIFFVSGIATLLQTTFGVRLILCFAVIFEFWARARELEATGTDYCYDNAKNALLA